MFVLSHVLGIVSQLRTFGGFKRARTHTHTRANSPSLAAFLAASTPRGRPARRQTLLSLCSRETQTNTLDKRDQTYDLTSFLNHTAQISTCFKRQNDEGFIVLCGDKDVDSALILVPLKRI